MITRDLLKTAMAAAVAGPGHRSPDSRRPCHARLRSPATPTRSLWATLLLLAMARIRSKSVAHRVGSYMGCVGGWERADGIRAGHRMEFWKRWVAANAMAALMAPSGQPTGSPSCQAPSTARSPSSCSPSAFAPHELQALDPSLRWDDDRSQTVLCGQRDAHGVIEAWGVAGFPWCLEPSGTPPRPPMCEHGCGVRHAADTRCLAQAVGRST
jgi:hypothetical protein